MQTFGGGGGGRLPMQGGQQTQSGFGKLEPETPVECHVGLSAGSWMRELTSSGFFPQMLGEAGFTNHSSLWATYK